MDATIDVEEKDLGNLVEELKKLREKRPQIEEEATFVSTQRGLEAEFPRKTKRKAKVLDYYDITTSRTEQECNDRCENSDEDYFRIDVFNVILDSVLSGLSTRFEAIRGIVKRFGFLWMYPNLSGEQLIENCRIFGEVYKNDVHGDGLLDEMQHLKMIHKCNISLNGDMLPPLDLLNKIVSLNLEEIFENVTISLRIFISIPVSIGSGERSFSTQGRVKNYMRSTMLQDRLCHLALLNIEHDLARIVDFQEVIDRFARKKVRKAMI